ncbi:MAG: nitroreductase [Gammaproteobacteria bacterium]|nr:nitroreductase [Gammaproteobacteria bacterium]
MSDLSVTDAIQSRRAVRVFTDQAVAKETLREILSLASRAPSNGNLQPWKVYAVTGDALREALVSINTGLYTDGNMEAPQYPIYPEKLHEPFRSRRHDCGELMYTALGIEREDKAGRIKQVMKNFHFFGAPVGIILTMDESMDLGQAMDVGIFAQTLMLLAKERGLDSCPQASWAQWPQRVRSALGIADDEKVMLGISLGYAADHPVNDVEQPRVPVEDFASLRGF